MLDIYKNNQGTGRVHIKINGIHCIKNVNTDCFQYKKKYVCIFETFCLIFGRYNLFLEIKQDLQRQRINSSLLKCLTQLFLIL